MKAVRLERLVGGKVSTNSKKKENKETGSQLDSKHSQEKEEDKGKLNT